MALAAPGDERWQVPACRVLEFGPRKSAYCVCVFVLDEGERLLRQLGRMRPVSGTVDVIVADGGSQDGSTDPEKLKALNVRTLLVKTGPGRLSAQMRMAFAYALRQGYEGVVVMDGSDKDDPGAIPAFVEGLRSGLDHIQGSRFIPGGKAENTPWPRWLGVRLIHAPLMSLAARFRYTDTTNGFRAYSRRLLSDPAVAVFRDVFMKYELHYYLAVRAPRLGYKTAEVPVTRRYPPGPAPSKINSVGGHLGILRQLVLACLGRFDPRDG